MQVSLRSDWQNHGVPGLQNLMREWVYTQENLRQDGLTSEEQLAAVVRTRAYLSKDLKPGVRWHPRFIQWFAGFSTPGAYYRHQLNSNIHENVGNEREKNILSLQGSPSAKAKTLRHGSWSLSSTIFCVRLQQLHWLSFGFDSATMAGSPNSSFIFKCWSHVPKIRFFLLTIKTFPLLGTFISVKHGKS